MAEQEKADSDVQAIRRELSLKKSTRFHGDVIIHFNRGVPVRMETREILEIDALKKAHEGAE